jgi:hypothetical protein
MCSKNPACVRNAQAAGLEDQAAAGGVFNYRFNWVPTASVLDTQYNSRLRRWIEERGTACLQSVTVNACGRTIPRSAYGLESQWLVYHLDRWLKYGERDTNNRHERLESLLHLCHTH